MNWRYIALFGIVLAFGMAFAVPFNASALNQQNLTRWAGGATDNVVLTEGGNISSMNLSVNTLTDRWAAFFGNLTGAIYLTDLSGSTTNYVYTWAASVASGGYACASNSPTFAFENAANADLVALNTQFNLGVASDNATNTFTATDCSLNFAGLNPLTNIVNTVTGGGFSTCAIRSTTAEGEYAFCTAVNSSGRNYLNENANYQLMVPTAPGTGIQTYYFYAELA